MDKSLIGLLAAVGAAIPLGGSAQGAVTTGEAQRALHATSIAELLDPVPNAVGVMEATAADRAAKAEERKVAQLYFGFGHHHHHHHHHWRHHHHHHHHYWHHHHHHHHYYNNDDE